MNKRKARQQRRELSPQARQAIKRFEQLRTAECRALWDEHHAQVRVLKAAVERDLAEVRERYAQSIEAVKRGDSAGILVATEVPT